MRVLFAGTPDVAVPALTTLLGSGHEVVGVLTRPPAPVGRRRVLTPSPVHMAAQEAGLDVITGTRPHEPQTLERIRGLAVECATVVAYGAILREPALSLLAHGWINLHFSLLPAWRGAAPVQHAIMAGDEITGASTFQIEAGLDTGPVFATMTEVIRPRDTAGELLGRLAHGASPLLVATLDAIATGEATGIAQPTDGVSLAPSLGSADARVDWRQPALVIDRHIRGVTPTPGAWTSDDRGRYKLGPVLPVPEPVGAGPVGPGNAVVSGETVYVGTGSTPVRLTTIAPPGKPWMDAKDWARGARHDTRFEASS